MNIEFEYDLQIEHKTLRVTVMAEAHVYIDKNYGADYDGNRGIESTFVEDLSYSIYDSMGNDITRKLKNLFNDDEMEEEIERRLLIAFDESEGY